MLERASWILWQLLVSKGGEKSTKMALAGGKEESQDDSNGSRFEVTLTWLSLKGPSSSTNSLTHLSNFPLKWR